MAAIGGKAVTQIQEGDKQSDLTVRFPLRLRWDESAIREIPVPVSNVAIGGPPVPSAVPPGTTTPTRPLEYLVTPLSASGQLDPGGSFLRPGASTIYREQGQRFIAIKFEARGRDLAGTVSDARAVVDPMLKPPYRAEWSGEFKQMEEAEKRIARMFALAMAVIVLCIYLAFRSWLDTFVVLANVLGVGIGGVWALKVAGLNFNISAAVGFISILGVAVMNGLILVSSFNALRHRLRLEDALREGVANRVRPLIMTLLTAILGLLPAALSTGIGSQSQRPLAVVVVGGMLATIVLFNFVPILYSFYGDRPPPEGDSDWAH
jgi:cobalt-zinc-cadmium resistance protein CzcA